MTESGIQPVHRERLACVYIRQSSPGQVERNRESTMRQYALVQRAEALGWPADRVEVVDDDLGLSGASVQGRAGFARLAAEVVLGHVGIVLGLEASRLARNNSDWYRLLDLCALTATLIADDDGIYDPSAYNDRLLLGLKGTISEAELHILKARLLEGLRNKAARGQLRFMLPVGFVWGELDGEVRFDPDEEVVGAVRSVFTRFAELGSIRRVQLWFHDEGVAFPVHLPHGTGIHWNPPSRSSISQVLANPFYAGAYAYGKTRTEHTLDSDGHLRTRRVKLPPEEWRVLLHDHHEGYIDWDTYEANRARIRTNSTRLRSWNSGGAVREGSALLQGLAVCGNCGRRLRTRYYGRNSAQGYYCMGWDEQRTGTYGRCLSVGGQRIDGAVAEAVLEAVRSLGAEAALRAEQELESGRDAALEQRRLAVERAEYEAARAERAYRAVDPENRRIARTLEREWEERLEAVERERAELALRERQRPRQLGEEERRSVMALGADLPRAWNAPTTTVRDRKELLRLLLEEVVLHAPRNELRARVVLRWKGGLESELEIDRPRSHPAPNRTDEDTIDLLRRLSKHYSDAIIAGILGKQGRTTSQGLRFTAERVANLRRAWKIPCYQPPEQPPSGEVVSVVQAARILGVAPSTIHRGLNDGILAGEQLTPGAPWRIRLTDTLRERFVEQAPKGFVPMEEAMRRLGISRQTVLQWVKVGKLESVTVCRGQRKGLRIKLPENPPSLFAELS